MIENDWMNGWMEFTTAVQPKGDPGGPEPTHIELTFFIELELMNYTPFQLFDSVNVPLAACNITSAVACLIKLLCFQASGCNALFSSS